VSQYQKGKTNLDFTEARDSEWQWHELGHTKVCTSLQTDNHASNPPFSFLQAGCPSCRPTNSVEALKAALMQRNTFSTSSQWIDHRHLYTRASMPSQYVTSQLGQLSLASLWGH